MIQTTAASTPFMVLKQNAPKAHSHPLIKTLVSPYTSVFEVFKPPFQTLIAFVDNDHHAEPIASPSDCFELRTKSLLTLWRCQTIQLATLGTFKAVTKKIEIFLRQPHVHNARFVWMQFKTVCFQPAL